MKKISVLSLLLIFLSSSAFAGTINLPRTGQTKCYDTSGVEIPCPGTGQDGEIQAGIAWPSPRFTVSGDCVTDNLTGLVWTKDANLPGGTKSWQGALDYVKSFNSSGGLCGFADWRLPNINELESLINSGEANTATWLNTQGFTNVEYLYYWSSTTYAYSMYGAWIVPVGLGRVDPGNKLNEYYVWPVRGTTTMPAQIWKTGQTKCYDTSGNEIACTGTGQDGEIQAGVAWPDPRFTVSGDVVVDNLTGLMWAENPDSTLRKWQEALDYANGLTLGGYTDWRLPNRKDLRSLSHYGEVNVASWLNTQGFYNVSWGYYWSSTTFPGAANNVWLVGMKVGGDMYTYAKDSTYPYTWAVRGLSLFQCTTWGDVIAKYNNYVKGQASWNDVISCYQEYASSE
jgi:hypothetical protein